MTSPVEDQDRKVEPPPEIAALEWIAGHSRPLANLADQARRTSARIRHS